MPYRLVDDGVLCSFTVDSASNFLDGPLSPVECFLNELVCEHVKPTVGCVLGLSRKSALNGA